MPEGRRNTTSWGSFFDWLLSAGRYIIIFTELIVITAFVIRFKLDFDLTKLYEEIEIKKETVVAQKSFEEEFRFIQENLLTIKELGQKRHTNQLALEKIQRIVPQTVTLTSFSCSDNKISIEAKAYSGSGLATFAYQLTHSPEFSDISIGKLQRSQNSEISFSLKATWEGETDVEKS